MKNIILIGPPGVGKGTQIKKLLAHYDFHHIAPGELFRQAIQEQTAIGREVQNYIERGALVPNSLVNELIAQQLTLTEAVDGVLFDGYPRTLRQAEALDELLAVQQKSVDLVIHLNATEETIRKRIEQRKKEIYRSDDQSEKKINTRIAHFNREIISISNHYQKQNKLHAIPSHPPIAEVAEQIQQLIDFHFFN